MRCEAVVGLGAVLVAACGGDHTSTGPPPNDSTPVLVTAVAIPPNYGIHDTYVRDGIAFVSAWNTGVMIYDVGNGVGGGTPAAPALLSTTAVTGGDVHSTWWFHNPSTGEKKYLFVAEEGPRTLGGRSSGALHVLDVSDLRHPADVATFRIDSAGTDTAGTHNFWMDENAQILYIAYYNAGVVALDVSGTLSGDLSPRGIDTLAPGGPGTTFTWGVQLANGSLYASDMISGFWQLASAAGHLSTVSGGGNVAERYGSDLWVAGHYAYTGTWGFAQRTTGVVGNALKVWALDSSGAPSLVDSVIVSGVVTVSDVEVSADGKLLMFTTEGGFGAGNGNGFYFYSLGDPAHPTFRGKYLVPDGVHTATFGYINGKTLVFGARDPQTPQLVILDATALDR